MSNKKEEETDLLEIRLKKETKLYWTKAITGAVSALVGRLFLGLIGWPMFIWMLSFWLGFPFIIGFLISPYDNEEWNWKIMLKTGVGMFFFTFMVFGTLIHTILKFLH